MDQRGSCSRIREDQLGVEAGLLKLLQQIIGRRSLHSGIAASSVNMLGIGELVPQNPSDSPAGGIVIGEDEYLAVADLLAQRLQLLDARSAVCTEDFNLFRQDAAQAAAVVFALYDNGGVHGVAPP